MENNIVGRLYYNRNKSHSFNNLGVPHSTKNKNIFSPIMQSTKENFNEDAKNEYDNVITTQGNFSKKNSVPTNFNQGSLNQKYELNDFNAFLEKLSKYENKKSFKK